MGVVNRCGTMVYDRSTARRANQPPNQPDETHPRGCVHKWGHGSVIVSVRWVLRVYTLIKKNLYPNLKTRHFDRLLPPYTPSLQPVPKSGQPHGGGGACGWLAGWVDGWERTSPNGRPRARDRIPAPDGVRQSWGIVARSVGIVASSGDAKNPRHFCRGFPVANRAPAQPCVCSLAPVSVVAAGVFAASAACFASNHASNSACSATPFLSI